MISTNPFKNTTSLTPKPITKSIFYEKKIFPELDFLKQATVSYNNPYFLKYAYKLNMKNYIDTFFHLTSNNIQKLSSTIQHCYKSIKPPHINLEQIAKKNAL